MVRSLIEEGGFEAIFDAAIDFLLPAFAAEFLFAIFCPGALANGGIKDFRMRMPGWHRRRALVVRVRNRFPGVTFRMIWVRMVRTADWETAAPAPRGDAARSPYMAGSFVMFLVPSMCARSCCAAFVTERTRRIKRFLECE